MNVHVFAKDKPCLICRPRRTPVHCGLVLAFLICQINIPAVKKILILALLPALFSSCKKDSDGFRALALAEETRLNVAYGSDAQQKMDLFLPAGRTQAGTKVLVLIHGGAWGGGDKDDFGPVIPTLIQRLPGWAIVNLNYRLGAAPATNLAPTQENDVRTAMAFIVSEASNYHFNTNKLGLLGGSAGAHLALLQGYKYSSPTPKAIVDYFGPTDMAGIYNFSSYVNQLQLEILMSGTPATNASLYYSFSPINYVTSKSAPTLILHGDADEVVPLEQSTALKTKLQSAGATVQMVVYPNEGHGFGEAAQADSVDKLVAFLTMYVR